MKRYAAGKTLAKFVSASAEG